MSLFSQLFKSIWDVNIFLFLSFKTAKFFVKVKKNLCSDYLYFLKLYEIIYFAILF